MSANFGVLVGLTLTWYIEEMLTSNICIRGFMCSAIKKSWKVSNIQCKQSFFIFRCREKAREKMMDLVQIMDSDTKKTAKVAKLKEWFVAREAQMAQLSLDGKLFLH